MATFKMRLQTILRPGLMLPLGATIAGIAAAASANHYLRDQAELSARALRQRYTTQNIVVASRDLPRGQILEPAMLAVRPVPQEYIPADAVPPARAAELLGGHTTISIRKGTPVVPAALTVERGAPQLSDVLRVGQRALTIQVDQVNAIGGHLSAGDAVDLYYSQREQNSTVLVPLLENVHVLATGAAMEPAAAAQVSDEGFSTITLQLDADQAARVVLAEQTGRVTVLLRAGGDQAVAEVRTRSSQQLLSTADHRSHLQRNDQPLIELLTGGHGEITPTRSWLKVGTATTATSREAL